MYVPLDVNFPDDEKIIEAGLDGAGLYAQSLCLAKRLEQDGRITRAHLARLGASDDLTDRLVRLGLFTENDGGLWITAWLAHNMSQAELDEKRATDAKRKRVSRKNRPNGRGEASENVTTDAQGASDDVRALEIETEIETERPQQQETDSVSGVTRDEVIDEAIDLLLRRDGTYDQAHSKQNPSGWLNAARKGRRSDHWQAACAAWTTDITPEALADILEPPPKPSVRLAEYVAGQDEGDMEAAAERIRRIKAEREAS